MALTGNGKIIEILARFEDNSAIFIHYLANLTDTGKIFVNSRLLAGNTPNRPRSY